MYDVEKDKVFLENFEREMLEYDEHLTMTLDVYLEYLRYIVQPLHQQVMSLNIQMGVRQKCLCFKISSTV